MNTLELLGCLAGGFLGSAHCIGMCGGFAVLIAGTGRPTTRRFSRQLIYSAGRIFTYAFLGTCAGALGATAAPATASGRLQNAFGIIAGAVMIVIGLSMLTRLPIRLVQKLQSTIARPVTNAASRAFHALAGAPGSLTWFLAGLMTGFLPCGLVYAFLAMAVGKGSLTGGTLTMIAFGLGTVPAMVATGMFGSLARAAVRARVNRIAAVLIVAMGVLTITRTGGDHACCTHPSTEHHQVAGQHQKPADHEAPSSAVRTAVPAVSRLASHRP